MERRYFLGAAGAFSPASFRFHPTGARRHGGQQSARRRTGAGRGFLARNSIGFYAGPQYHQPEQRRRQPFAAGGAGSHAAVA